MSNANLFLLSGFPRAPLQNGIGRYIPQCKRIVLKFCKSTGGSRGMREFIEKDIVDFSQSNPATVVYVKPRRHRSASLTAEYLNGEKRFIHCSKMSYDEIRRWIHYLTTRSGVPTNFRYRKLWHTDSPSIQGVWSPFTNRNPELNVATYPMEDFSKIQYQPPTATEVLIKMFEEQKLETQDKEGIKNDQIPVQK